MSETISGATPVPPRSVERDRTLAQLRESLSFRRISAIYVWIALIVLFSITRTDTFLRWDTVSIVGRQQAITALAALGLVLPLAVGAYDLSIGAMIGLSSAVAAVLMVNEGVPWPFAMVLAILCGILCGVISGLLIVKARIQSLIATLGMSSLMLAAVSFVTADREIVGLPEPVREVAAWKFLSLPGPLYYVLGLALVTWYVLQQTPMGRQMYATGGNREAAKLAGVPVNRLTIIALAMGGALAAAAGMVLLSQVGTAQPGVGPDYLLPAFAAVFLGATQFGTGRFNVWGTIVGVYALGTGVYGIQLMGGSIWVANAFDGLALLAAVALASAQRTKRKKIESSHEDHEVNRPSGDTAARREPNAVAVSE